MPSWKDGLVEAFPIPDEYLNKWSLKEDEAERRKTALPVGPHLSSFFELPAETRNRVYALLLFSKPEYRRRNGTRPSKLSIMLASRRCHEEAAYVLYTTYRFRVFAMQEFTRLPSIQELPLHYQILVANLELKLGSSFTQPPREWKVTPELARCLSRLDAVQTLRIFVELDPSHPIFVKYTISRDFYTDFCGELLRDTLHVMPQLEFIEIAGNPSVQVKGPLISRVRAEAQAAKKTIKWAKDTNWTEDDLIYMAGNSTGSNPWPAVSSPYSGQH